MKNGFTLMELLVVIVIVSVISVSSVLAFGNIDDSTAIKDRKNIYMDLQRKALLYADLDNSQLRTFRTDRIMDVMIKDLARDEYINEDIEDPVTGEMISQFYIIRLYIADDGTETKKGNEYVDSCIVDHVEINKIYCQKDIPCDPSNNITCDSEDNCSCYNKTICDQKACISNSYGEPYDCCSKLSARN